jgi:hypothetical protein
MCKECVTLGIMTQEQLDSANETDSDRADFSGISALFAGMFGEHRTPEQKLADTVELVLEGTQATYAQTLPLVTEDPDGPESVITRATWAGAKLVQDLAPTTLGVSQVLLVLEVQRGRERVTELERSIATLTAQNQELGRRLNRSEEHIRGLEAELANHTHPLREG